MRRAKLGRTLWAGGAVLLSGPGAEFALPASASATVTAGVARAPALGSSGAADSGFAFRPLAAPDDHFSISDLTRAYERDLTLWMSPRREPVRGLAWLDRYGTPTGGPAAIDSSDIDLIGGAERRDPTAMTPDQRAAAETPTAGVRVGIPSPVAVAGSLLGGVAILIKLIAELAR